MAMIDIKLKDSDKSFKMTEKLVSDLLAYRTMCLNHDFDFCAVLGGKEGSGKSSLAMQIGSLWMGQRFNVNDNVHWDVKKLMERAIGSEETQKGDLFILDESYRSAAAIKRGTKNTEELIAFLTEVRKKNLAFLFLAPNIYDLANYFIFHRAKIWINCYLRNKVERGRFKYYSEKNIDYIHRKNYKEHKIYPAHIGREMRFETGYGFIDKDDYLNAVNEYLESFHEDQREKAKPQEGFRIQNKARGRCPECNNGNGYFRNDGTFYCRSNFCHDKDKKIMEVPKTNG